MSETKIQLQITSILGVPIDSYSKDFVFIVNGEEFQTTKIISDLLSPKISQIHKIDPTFDTYTIFTRNRGNFSRFLQLINFSEETIPNDDLPFLAEILDNLQNDHITLKLPPRKEKVTIENVISLIQTHEKNNRFYSEYLKEEIEFLCKHFYELQNEQEQELKKISIDTLESILQKKELIIRDENQLLNFLNTLYSIDSKYSILYKYVYFSIVSEESIREFVDNFDINDIDSELWQQLSKRLKQKVVCDENFLKGMGHKSQNENQPPKSKGKEFVCNHDNKFDGIINFLIKQSNNNIQNLINITSSSINGNSQSYTPYNVCLFDENNKDKIFLTNDEPNSWICFDFKDHKIIPTNYVIKSSNYGKNDWNPKTWILESSNDGTNWKTIDEQHEVPYLDGKYLVHTFDIRTQIKDPVRYIRLKQTGKNRYPSGFHVLSLGSIEFYGNFF